MGEFDHEDKREEASRVFRNPPNRRERNEANSPKSQKISLVECVATLEERANNALADGRISEESHERIIQKIIEESQKYGEA